MKVEGEHTFNGTREEVWNMFRDTEVMSAALPGTKSMELVGENKYQAVMNVRVGPVAGEFSGDLVISNEKYPDSYTMTVEGKGKPVECGAGRNRLCCNVGESRSCSVSGAWHPA